MPREKMKMHMQEVCNIQMVVNMMRRAGTAFPIAAPFLCTGEFADLPQKVEECPLGLNLSPYYFAI